MCAPVLPIPRVGPIMLADDTHRADPGSIYGAFHIPDVIGFPTPIPLLARPCFDCIALAYFNAGIRLLRASRFAPHSGGFNFAARNAHCLGEHKLAPTSFTLSRASSKSSAGHIAISSCIAIPAGDNGSLGSLTLLIPSPHSTRGRREN
jgi:hypothetical protein